MQRREAAAIRVDAKDRPLIVSAALKRCPIERAVAALDEAGRRVGAIRVGDAASGEEERGKAMQRGHGAGGVHAEDRTVAAERTRKLHGIAAEAGRAVKRAVLALDQTAERVGADVVGSKSVQDGIGLLRLSAPGSHQPQGQAEDDGQEEGAAEMEVALPVKRTTMKMHDDVSLRNEQTSLACRIPYGGPAS